MVVETNFSLLKSLDIAIGSPNAEMVHVYRSYPVVKVIANVIPLTKELKITDTSFKFKVCWSLESKYDLPIDTGESICFFIVYKQSSLSLHRTRSLAKSLLLSESRIQVE